MLTSVMQSAEKNHTIKKAKNPLKYAAKFEDYGMILTNQNYVCDEIEKRLNSGFAFYHSIQNRLSSALQATNITEE